ncbi:MAG: hypothetical protein V9G10_07465 [Candidatus Nanopelagicales bacterium]
MQPAARQRAVDPHHHGSATPTTLIDLQPCGGTHVANTAEIGAVVVTKIEKKSATTPARGAGVCGLRRRAPHRPLTPVRHAAQEHHR